MIFCSTVQKEIEVIHIAWTPLKGSKWPEQTLLSLFLSVFSVLHQKWEGQNDFPANINLQLTVVAMISL